MADRICAVCGPVSPNEPVRAHCGVCFGCLLDVVPHVACGAAWDAGTADEWAAGALCGVKAEAEGHRAAASVFAKDLADQKDLLHKVEAERDGWKARLRERHSLSWVRKVESERDTLREQFVDRDTTLRMAVDQLREAGIDCAHGYGVPGAIQMLAGERDTLRETPPSDRKAAVDELIRLTEEFGGYDREFAAQPPDRNADTNGEVDAIRTSPKTRAQVEAQLLSDPPVSGVLAWHEAPPAKDESPCTCDGCVYREATDIGRKEGMAERDTLRRHVEALAVALEGVADYGPGGPCWCIDAPSPGPHSDYCLTARAALDAAKGVRRG